MRWCKVWPLASREFSRVKGCKRWQRGFISSGFESIFIVCDRICLQRKAGQWVWPLVVFQPCGTWWLQSSACNSWYFQMLLIYSLFPCSPLRACAAKLSELAGFRTVRASQMRDALAPRRGEGRAAPPRQPRQGAPQAAPAARPSPALALNQREFCASALANLLWFRAVEPAVCNLM